MTVADIIEYAKYGELAQLGVVKQLKCNTPVEVVEAEKQIISYINLGLIELFKRFSLRTEETIVVLSNNTTLYTISIPILNSIQAAYDEEGKEYNLNSENDALSILTPSYNTIQVPNPIEGAAVYIIYNASPDKLEWADILSNIVVPIPPVMLEPLLHYIGYRAHGAMNGEMNAENNTHYMRFEASCKNLLDLGVIPTDDGLVEGTKLEEKGFV